MTSADRDKSLTAFCSLGVLQGCSQSFTENLTVKDIRFSQRSLCADRILKIKVSSNIAVENQMQPEAEFIVLFVVRNTSNTFDHPTVIDPVLLKGNTNSAEHGL